MQLPKKDAGAGLAFGAGASDALFGAGSGNVLTKATKYACGTFFSLALLLSILNAYHGKHGSQRLEDQLNQLGSEPAPTAQTPGTVSPTPGTNLLISAAATNKPLVATPTPLVAPTNAPAK